MLQSCLNGGRDREFHPAIPYTPEELAQAAKEVVAAGAQCLHVHPRAEDGAESLHPDIVAKTLKAIRAAVPGVPVGLTTGWWVPPTGRARQDHIRDWYAVPDYVSVNLAEEDAPEVITLALQMGIGVEAALWSTEDAEHFVSLTTAPRCLRILIEMFNINPSQKPRTIDELLEETRRIRAILAEAGIDLPQLLHGAKETFWPMYRAALKLGLDTRVGLEDNKYLPDGSIAKNNADFVRTALAIGRP